MRIFVFAIGGTGARVLRSLSMLLASGCDGMDSTKEIVPIIIDFDMSNGDKTRTEKLLKTYQNIYQLGLGHTQKQDDNFFMTPIKALKDITVAGHEVHLRGGFDINFAQDNNDKTFAKFIEYNLMNNTLNLSKDLFESLYDDSMGKDAELNLDLSKGFKGNPNIGSVIFQQLKDTDEYKHFLNVFQPGDRVFIISSIFGGTGSSGFPQLVNCIRTANHNHVKNSPIGAVVVLPYFKVTDDAQSAINSDLFISKTKAALSFYEKGGINNRVNDMYYLADSAKSPYNNKEGGESQKNNAHIVELIAAMSIIDFIKKPTELLVASQAHEFGILNNNETINIANFFDETRSEYLDYLTMFSYFSKYYDDVLYGKTIRPNVAYYAALSLEKKIGKEPFHKKLKDFILEYKIWLKELATNDRKFEPYQDDLNGEFRLVLKHKPLQLGKITRSNPLSQNDFDSTMNVKYNDVQNKIKHEDECFLTISRQTAKELFEKVNKI